MNIAVIILALALAAVLLVRVRIRVTRTCDRWRCEVRYGRFALIDTAHGWQHRQTTLKGERTAKSYKGLPVARLIEVVPDVMRASGKGLRFLLRHTRLDCLRMSGTLEGTDPAETAMLYGLICALVALVHTQTRVPQVAVAPEFMGGGTHLWIEAEASIQAATLAAMPFVILPFLPKRALVQFAIKTLRRPESWSFKTS